MFQMIKLQTDEKKHSDGTEEPKTLPPAFFFPSVKLLNAYTGIKI